MKIDKNMVKVIVAGHASVGKSTIIQILADALAAAGIKHEVLVDDLDSYTHNPALQQIRIEDVKRQAKVSIEERHVRQSLVSNNYEVVDVED